MRLPQRPKTTLQVSAATKAAAKGKWLSLKAWKAVRKSMTTETGWNTKQYDAWLANEVNEGNYKVAASHPKAGTTRLREAVIATAAEGTRGDMLQAMLKVRQWLDRRVSGTHITAPKIRQMEANLTRKGDPRSRISAAIILTAMDEEMTVEDRRQGTGRGRRNWLQETLTWAAKRGWLRERRQTKAEVQAAAADTVASHPKKPESVGTCWMRANCARSARADGG